MRGALVAVAANGVAGLPAGAEEVGMVVLRKVLARMERRPGGTTAQQGRFGLPTRPRLR